MQHEGPTKRYIIVHIEDQTADWNISDQIWTFLLDMSDEIGLENLRSEPISEGCLAGGLRGKWAWSPNQSPDSVYVLEYWIFDPSELGAAVCFLKTSSCRRVIIDAMVPIQGDSAGLREVVSTVMKTLQDLEFDIAGNSRIFTAYSDIEALAESGYDDLVISKTKTSILLSWLLGLLGD